MIDWEKVYNENLPFTSRLVIWGEVKTVKSFERNVEAFDFSMPIIENNNFFPEAVLKILRDRITEVSMITSKTK